MPTKFEDTICSFETQNRWIVSIPCAYVHAVNCKNVSFCRQHSSAMTANRHNQADTINNPFIWEEEYKWNSNWSNYKDARIAIKCLIAKCRRQHRSLARNRTIWTSIFVFYLTGLNSKLYGKNPAEDGFHTSAIRRVSSEKMGYSFSDDRDQITDKGLHFLTHCIFSISVKSWMSSAWLFCPDIDPQCVTSSTNYLTNELHNSANAV